MTEDSYLRYLEMVKTLAEHGLERRRDLRVCPHPQRPVMLHLPEQSCQVNDISPGGLSFHASGRFQPDYWLMGALELPGQTQSLEVTLMVVEHGTRGLVRCRFAEEMQGEAGDIIRDYIQQRLAEIEQAA